MTCRKCNKTIPEGSAFCNWCGAAQEVKKSARKRGNGGGTAFKRGKTWTAMVSLGSYVEEVDGKKVLRRVRATKGGFRTKSEALEYIPTLKNQNGKKVPTILDLWNSWSRSDMTKLSDSKQTAYEIAKDRLKPIWARRIDTLVSDDLQNVVNSATKTYYPARDMKTLLSHFYKRAMRDQYVTINLANFIVLPELEEQSPEPFYEEEVAAIWELYRTGETFAGYILLMIYSGMMPGELMSCKTDMIDFDKHEIYGCGKKTKKRKDTPIVFSDFVSPVLKDLCTMSKNGKLLAINKDRFYTVYYETLEKAGCRKLTPYSCRHTTATDAVKKNIAPSAVQELMRHAKLETTQRYIHMGREDAHNAANAMTKEKSDSD